MWVARKIRATAQPPALKVQLPFFFPTPHRCPQRDRFLFNRSTFTLRGRHFPASPSININHLIPAPSGSNCRSEEWCPPAQGSPQTLGISWSLVLLCCSLPCSLTPSFCEDGTRQVVSLQRLGHSLFSLVLSNFPKNTNQGEFWTGRVEWSVVPQQHLGCKIGLMSNILGELELAVCRCVKLGEA